MARVVREYAQAGSIKFPWGVISTNGFRSPFTIQDARVPFKFFGSVAGETCLYLIGGLHRAKLGRQENAECRSAPACLWGTEFGDCGEGCVPLLVCQFRGEYPEVRGSYRAKTVNFHDMGCLPVVSFHRQCKNRGPQMRRSALRRCTPLNAAGVPPRFRLRDVSAKGMIANQGP